MFFICCCRLLAATSARGAQPPIKPTGCGFWVLPYPVAVAADKIGVAAHFFWLLSAATSLHPLHSASASASGRRGCSAHSLTGSIAALPQPSPRLRLMRYSPAVDRGGIPCEGGRVCLCVVGVFPHAPLAPCRLRVALSPVGCSSIGRPRGTCRRLRRQAPRPTQRVCFPSPLCPCCSCPLPAPLPPCRVPTTTRTLL